MSEVESLLFVHVPKTAGTSFRLAVEGVFPGRVAYDYALRAPETWDGVRRHVYGKLDLEALRRELTEARITMLGGHVIYRRYSALFAPQQVITFLREPIARLVSEHEHACRHNGFTGTLREFAAIPRNQNLQSKMLAGVPLGQAALVGITERYGESLALLEKRVGWKVSELVRNVNPAQAELAGRYALDAEMERELRALNGEDLAFYEEACRRFEEVAGARAT